MQQLFELYYSCTGVSTDTRTIGQGNLFVCLKGDRYDANNFADQALTEGAKYVISSDKQRCDEKVIFYVEDTLEFLQLLANHHRRKFDIPIIGITGSNGKTTTKEIINAVLATTYCVLCTKGNLNNHIGVPLTLLQLNADHELAIIEMGANKPGDIDELCTIAEPTHGIITNIGRAHLEGFGNFEGVLQTKLALYKSIGANGGTLFYNVDDILLRKHLSTSNVIGYSINSPSTCQGTLIRLTPFVCFTYESEGKGADEIQSHLIGAYNLYNFLAAVCIGKFFKVTDAAIKGGIEAYVPSNNRSQVEKTAKNTLIVDCYNANPSSMSAALESFAQLTDINKLAILGDMLELGDVALEEHHKIISLCESKNIRFITIGQEFGKLNSPSHFESAEALINDGYLDRLENTTILLKGSRGIGLERLISFL